MIETFAEKYKLPKFRIDQFNKAFYQDRINSFDELSTWSKELRENLKKEVAFSSLKVEKELISAKKDTIKVAFKRKRDNKIIETVLMRFKDDRNTICVSCMVGCPMGCAFCATGKMGFQGNLSANEIVDQIMHFKRLLVKEGKEITNIVFMGMGEPLLNLDEVQKATEIINNPEKLGLGVRRVTVSTCGITDKLEELIDADYKGKLAISLHAPNQELREKIMPVAKKYTLDGLFKVLDKYTAKTNKRITYEYILIDNLNDTNEHAMELAKLLKGRLALVNLIRYNPVLGIDFETSSQKNVLNFSQILTDQGINNTIRASMGQDVNAACGQLASKK
jgi:23S rRNA (adenine2503-C2)-methyltransferase